ncbi:MAG TPA: class I SAM-dependent methyltransferase [Bacillales bacterium]|nr:class I SAM-dependent methyltransferase [Bacillales bacterium]
MTNTEKCFQVLDDSSVLLSETEDVPYLEALAETGENLFQHAVLQPVRSEVVKKLEDLYSNIDIEQLKAEEIRKAFQLAVLKGMKAATQPNHEMTPDAVSLFIGYLFNKLSSERDSVTILDPAVGSGNLLTAVLNSAQTKVDQSYAVDADELLLKLAYVSSNLQKHATQFFHQDSIQPLLIDPVDCIVCDLPIGYYPHEAIAAGYDVRAKSGRSFAHHLLIEQSLRHLKDGGYAIFLIPNGLFESDQAGALKTFISKTAAIQGLLQLPLTMFKKEHYAKSIMILQKHGENAHPPSQTLLVHLPSFSNERAMQSIVQQIDDWFRKEKPHL